MRRTVALLVVSGAMARAQPVSIEGLRDLLIPARQHTREHVDTRFATPELTRVKHYLRHWIESRLTPLDQDDEDTELTFQLNAELDKAGLTCRASDQCPEQDYLGFLGDIRVHRSGDFLIVQTAVGILCGDDESAYIYERKENLWQRFWDSEQNDYTKDKYFPQHFWEVLISGTNYAPGADKSEHLIVTLAQYPWCASNWQTIYYRVWRTSGGHSQLLLDENEIGFVSEPLSAAAWPNDVLIEYAIASIDGGVHNRRRLRHYVLDHGALKRTDPFALSPRDFADELITGAPDEVLRHLTPTVRTELASWDRRFKGPFELVDPTLHCTQEKDLWQVSVQNAKTAKPMGYFLVRWRPPYNFSLAGLSDRPSPGCTEKDPKADEFRTLFPDRDQH